MISYDSDALVPPAVDTLPVQLAVVDAFGTVVFANQAWQSDGSETDPRPAIGSNYLDALGQVEVEDVTSIAAGLRELLAGDRELLEVEYSSPSSDRERWFLLRATPFAIDGERYAAIAHFDITPRVESDRRLTRFQRSVETAGHAIFITDLDGVITYVNPAFEEITGYESAEAIGQTPQLLHSDEMDEAFYTELWETILAGEIWEGTIVNRRKSGELYYAHQIIAPVFDDGTFDEFVAIQTDVTEITEKRKQVEKLQNVLRHDLRNQLNVVHGYTDLLQGEEIHEDVAEYADILADALNEILSSVEKGQRLLAFLSDTTSPEPIDVVAVVERTVETQCEAHPETTITLDTPPEARALAVSKLDQAVVELIENAVRHVDHDAPEIAVTVRSRENWVEVQVADNGPGIPEMERESLDSRVVTQLYHDTGFGLNLAYWIARRSGGRLRFEENEPRGTVVAIELPTVTE